MLAGCAAHIRKYSPKYALAILAMLLSMTTSALGSEVARRPNLQVQLVADSASVAPGGRFQAGLHFRLEDGWHIYWQNAGDSGEPPSITWKLPPTVQAGSILWPVPKRIDVEPFVNYGYEEEILLPIPMQVAPTLASDTLPLAAEVNWLVCKEECTPGTAHLQLSVPVRPEGSTPDPDWSPMFEAARNMLPRPQPRHWTLAGALSRDAFQLSIQGVPGPVQTVSFFPQEGDHIANDVPPQVNSSASAVELRLQRSDRLLNEVTHLAGVLVLATETGGTQAYQVDFPLGGLGVRGLLPPLFLALAGGLLLNLMPCVFPVLSLKVMSVVQMSGEGRSRIIRMGWAYTLGILVSFWVLVAALLMLRYSGLHIGWGFQLQSPQFVFVLASVLFAFALNLLGCFEISGRFTAYGSSLAYRPGYVGSFFTGVLATLVATPCTAPFMGAAIGFAVGQSSGVVFGIFTALAIGLALPYLLLSYIPAVGRWLPRPGRWMETFKQLMAFLVFGTVIWLAWVLGLQTSPAGLITLLLAFFSIGFLVWIASRWRRAAPVAVLLGVAAVITAAFSLEATVPTQRGDANAREEHGLAWEPFSPAKVAEYRAQGRPIFIDFTAAWCVSCQVNELMVFRSEEVKSALKNRGFALLKADWTNHDPVITQALASFGRNGVPFYVIYGEGKDSPAVPLPEIINAGVVLQALENLP
jgi:thiol:disulfide interchange protein/DsbC/DsbD-like thiol-disulfide interchange protein